MHHHGQGRPHALNTQGWHSQQSTAPVNSPVPTSPSPPISPVLNSQACRLPLPRASCSPRSGLPCPPASTIPARQTEGNGEAQRAPLPEPTPVRRQTGLQTPTGRNHIAKPASRMADTHKPRECQAESFLPWLVLLPPLREAGFRGRTASGPDGHPGRQGPTSERRQREGCSQSLRDSGMGSWFQEAPGARR